ncbi:hypothetical protein DAMA08_051770 [Martiniozyma asiatica (nom. inval.)]|nr:hypothetical protein DAMA08_051770 [Martiniozyma asiatica]
MSSPDEPQEYSIAITHDLQRHSRSRRGSIFDVGGEDSLNNFASSVKRSVNYLSSSYESHHQLSSPGLMPLIGTSQPNSATLNNTFGVSEISNEQSALLKNGHESDYTGVNPSVLETNELTLTPILSANSFQIIYDEEEAILKIITTKSTPSQTIFNSINVLIGLGVFSIPLALHLSGWIFGIIFLSLAAYSTKWTSILLGRILKDYPHLKTYQDIGIMIYGEKIGKLILFTFALDLFGAGISMMILFADSFNALFPQIPESLLKIIITTLLFVLNFMPLRLLSFLSLVGISCTSLTCIIIILSGLIKNNSSPGSLILPMPTNLWPGNLIDLFFSLGLYLAPWGGHATFPEIYNDQDKPETFSQCMNCSFGFSYFVDLITGVTGFLMFGKLIEDEVTKNIIKQEGYPGWIGTSVVIFTGLLPISKLPLVCRPIITALDSYFETYESIWRQSWCRLCVSLLYLLASLLLTDFSKVMSLLGSAICFAVCIILPISYYVRIYQDKMQRKEYFMWQTIIVLSIIGAVLGTLAVILR